MRFAFDGVRLVPDVRARLGGRGVWVHATRSCVAASVRSGGFARVLRAKCNLDIDVLVGALVEAHAERLEALLAGARRARLIACGTDECLEALGRHGGFLVVVAADECSAHDVVLELASQYGVASVAVGSKASLGRCFGKDEVGVVVVADRSLADSISQVATRIATLSEGE